MCVCVPVERVSLIAANGQHCHLAADKTVNVNVTVTNGATVAQLPFCPLAGRGSGLAADGGRGGCETSCALGPAEFYRHS